MTCVESIDHGTVRELRLARPPVNALNPALCTDLADAVAAAVHDGAHGLVLSGGPNVFSAGLDVPYLYGDTLAGQAVYVNGLDSSDGDITVEYARATNVRLSPVYQPSPAVNYEDVG